LSQNSNLPSP